MRLHITQFHNLTKFLLKEYDDIEIDLEEEIMEGCMFEPIIDVQKIYSQIDEYESRDIKGLMKDHKSSYYYTMNTMKGILNEFTRPYATIEHMKDQVLIILVWNPDDSKSCQMIKKFNTIMNANKRNWIEKNVRLVALCKSP